MFTNAVLKRCQQIMRDVCVDFEAELREFNGEPRSRALPTESPISKLVNSLIGVSARELRKEFDLHVRRYLCGGHSWSGSYFAGSCAGAPLTVARQYIQNQQRPPMNRPPRATHGEISGMRSPPP